MLYLLHQQSARHFLHREHRRNVMAGLTSHVLRLHGPAAIPPPVAKLLRLP